MLKELWRKLGAELWPGNRTGRTDSFGANDHAYSDSFRILPHITHTGEFHLERLSQVLRARYGYPPKGSTPGPGNDSILGLISFAARIQDQDVQRELLLFYLNCSPVIQEYLRAETDLGEGPLLPR